MPQMADFFCKDCVSAGSPARERCGYRSFATFLLGTLILEAGTLEDLANTRR